MSDVKARLSVKAALWLVALFGIAALIVSVKGTPHKVELPSDDDLHTHITLSVMFTPQKRTRTVNVQAHVEGIRVVPPQGAPTEYLPLVQSPWNVTIRVPKGVQVSLYAFQDEAPRPGNLDCVITGIDPATGRVGVLSNGHRADIGSVRCYVNRVGG